MRSIVLGDQALEEFEGAVGSVVTSAF